MTSRGGRRWAALVLAVVVGLTGACGSSSDDDVASPFDTSTSTTVAHSSTAPTTTPGGVVAPTTVPPTPAAGDARVVVIDPGHNGANTEHPEVINSPVDAGGFQKACNTTGASTDNGVTESAINWAVAQALRDRLEAAGITVVLTRDSDDGVGPCIDQRGRLAAESHALALVSLHADGAGRGDHGFHVIHPALVAGYTDATVEPSLALATQVRDDLVAAGFVPSTYVGTNGLDERGDLGTLNRAGVPAVMLEAGNLRNPDDASLLTTAQGQSRLADALATAVLSYLA